MQNRVSTKAAVLVLADDAPARQAWGTPRGGGKGFAFQHLASCGISSAVLQQCRCQAVLSPCDPPDVVWALRQHLSWQAGLGQLALSQWRSQLHRDHQRAPAGACIVAKLVED
jgi:hypothetical protein